MDETAQVPRAHRARVRAIFDRLEEIDRASVRPARAVAVGSATQRDMDVLQELEMEAVGLREELRGLSA
jgi:hypothetical protein